MGAPSAQQILTGTTTHNVAMPGTVAAGRLLIVILASSFAVTTPSGWTLKKTISATSSCILNVYTRIADGTEGGTNVNFVTSSGDFVAAHVYYASDANYNASICFAVSTGATGTSTTPDPDSLTSGFGAVDTTWIAACVAATNDITGFPASYGNTAETYFLYGILGTADRDVNGSSQNPGSFTIASAAWAAITIGIQVNTTTTPVVTSVTPDEFSDGDAGVVVGGTGFLSPQSTGKVELGDNSDYSQATKEEQTVTSWGTTSITFTVDKGSLNYGSLYVFVTNSDGNVSNGWSVTLVEAPLALSAAAGVGACRLGLEVYEVGASTPLGIVTQVIEADTDEQISKLYQWSAKVPASARNATLLTKSRVVAIIREMEGEVFRGRIESRVISLKGDEKVLTVSGPSIDVELSDAFTYEGLLIDGEVAADAYDAVVALAETAWTANVEVSAPAVSRRWDDASVTNVRMDLDKIFHAYSRLTTTLRELNVKSTSQETGIRLRQTEKAGPELLKNPAIGLIDSMEISEEAFNVYNRIVPFGSSKNVLNGVRFGIGTSNRTSPYTIQSRINSAPSFVAFGTASGQVNSPADQNVGTVEVAGLNTALIVTLNVRATDIADRCQYAYANGNFMTPSLEVTVGSHRYQVFYLLNPQQGNASLQFLFNSANSTIWDAQIWSLRDVYQAGDPIRASATASGTGTAVSVAVTSTDDDFVVDHMLRDSGAGSQTIGAGQTSVNNAANTAASYEIPAGASSTTMTWTLNTSDNWRTLAVSIKPSTNFYIEDSASVTAHGRRTRALIFSDFQDAIGSSQEAANTLYEKAVDYLQKHKDGTAFYRCEIAYLAQGARAWNIGDSLRVEYQDADLDLDIDDMLVCVGRKAKYDSDGVRHWTLTLADVFSTPEDDAQVISSIASDVQSLRVNQV